MAQYEIHGGRVIETNNFLNITKTAWTKIIKDFDLPVQFIGQSQMVVFMGNMLESGMTEFEHVAVLADEYSKYTPEEQESIVAHIHKVSDKIIDVILNSEGWKEFNTCDINEAFPLDHTNIPNGDVYNHNYVDQSFITIDLTEGAFQSIQVWDTVFGNNGFHRILPNDVHSYLDLVQYAGDLVRKESEHWVSGGLILTHTFLSKRLRQVMFGKTNPKRLMHVEKYIVQRIMQNIENAGGPLPIRLNNDELIYEYSPELDTLLAENADNLMNYEVHNRSFYGVHANVKINCFDLLEYKIKQHNKPTLIAEDTVYNGPTVYIKDNYTIGKHDKLAPSFKCLPSKFYCIFRCLMNDLSLMALWFMKEPIIVDGILHWMSDSSTWYSIECTGNKEYKHE